jgi:type II secretory pathway component PulJ
MTLLELVVALAITGFVVSGGYATFATLMDRRDAAAKTASRLMRHSTARALLAEWLASARLTIEADEVVFRGIDGATRGTATALADDDIVFFTTAVTPVGRNGTIVHLYVDRSAESPERGLVAELREFEGMRSARMELEAGVAGLDAQFLTGVLGQRQWVKSWVSTSVLPTGVRLAVSAVPPDSLPPLWRFPITASIEGSR